MPYRVWIGVMALAAWAATVTQADARSHRPVAVQNASDVAWNNDSAANAAAESPRITATINPAVAEPLPPQMEQQVEKRLRENLSP